MKLSAYELALLEASKSVNATGHLSIQFSGMHKNSRLHGNTNYNYIKHKIMDSMHNH